jgi:hypothetical protein
MSHPRHDVVVLGPTQKSSINRVAQRRPLLTPFQSLTYKAQRKAMDCGLLSRSTVERNNRAPHWRVRV